MNKKTDFEPFPVGDNLVTAQESGKLKSTELLVEIDLGGQKVSLSVKGMLSLDQFRISNGEISARSC